MRVVRGVAVMSELFCRRIKTVQAATAGSNPQGAGTIFRDYQNPVVVYVIGIIGIALVDGILSAFPVELIESPPKGADPQVPPIVFV